jgi:hypothetical protein
LETQTFIIIRGRNKTKIKPSGFRRTIFWAKTYKGNQGMGVCLGIYPKDCDTGYSRGTCTPMFIVALFTIAKLWKQPRCPTTD